MGVQSRKRLRGHSRVLYHHPTDGGHGAEHISGVVQCYSRVLIQGRGSERGGRGEGRGGEGRGGGRRGEGRGGGRRGEGRERERGERVGEWRGKERGGEGGEGDHHTQSPQYTSFILFIHTHTHTHIETHTHMLTSLVNFVVAIETVFNMGVGLA